MMGVLNVTPDSFSGDGVGHDTGAALEQALRFREWGADIIDAGAESTRPPSVYAGAEPHPGGRGARTAAPRPPPHLPGPGHPR